MRGKGKEERDLDKVRELRWQSASLCLAHLATSPPGQKTRRGRSVWTPTSFSASFLLLFILSPLCCDCASAKKQAGAQREAHGGAVSGTRKEER